MIIDSSENEDSIIDNNSGKVDIYSLEESELRELILSEKKRYNAPSQQEDDLFLFGDILFGILIGVGIVSIKQFELWRWNSVEISELLLQDIPFILCFFGILIYIIIAWLNLRREMTLLAIFNEERIGVVHYLSVVFMAIIFFQTLESAVKPIGDMEGNFILHLSGWVAIYYSADFVSSVFIARPQVMKMVQKHIEGSTVWQPISESFLPYYSKHLPLKASCMLIIPFFVLMSWATEFSTHHWFPIIFIGLLFLLCSISEYYLFRMRAPFHEMSIFIAGVIRD